MEKTSKTVPRSLNFLQRHPPLVARELFSLENVATFPEAPSETIVRDFVTGRLFNDGCLEIASFSLFASRLSRTIRNLSERNLKSEKIVDKDL